jgi:hypothetical protein
LDVLYRSHNLNVKSAFLRETLVILLQFTPRDVVLDEVVARCREFLSISGALAWK